MYWNGNRYRNPVSFSRLIETWDVLKYCLRTGIFDRDIRLIETWDVLKYGCGWDAYCRSRLIETWDVLK